MGKFVNLTIFFSTVLILLHVFGFIPSGAILSLILNPQNILSSEFWAQEGIILGLTSIAGIFLGYFVYQLDLLAIAPFLLWFIPISIDFVSVFALVSSVNPVLAGVILSPLYFTYFMSSIEFWRGRD